jgi:hypothetical protein
VSAGIERRRQHLFLALVLAQTAHSVEEYVFRLWEVLAPARLVSRLVSSDPASGFAIANAAIILLASWCYVARIRGAHPSGTGWAWFWTILEAANGTLHLALAAQRGGYFPGAATAPALLVLAVCLGFTLARAAPAVDEPPAPTR